MNIYNYMDQYGCYSFEEKPINEVDCVIFSFLSYADFDHIVENKKISLKDVGRMHLGLHKKGEKNVMAVREATKMLTYMKDTKRYRDCSLFHYVYESTKDYQFSAISIEYQKNRVFVSYEGTDQMISGWKENFLLSYSFPTITHTRAIEYLNRFYTFSMKKLIVGGHSKGGNLALVASMCCNSFARSHIKMVYNMDGPGLLDKEFRSKRFRRILPKYKQIIPEDSIVGIMLYSSNVEVIHSKATGILSHNVAYWEVEKDHFKKDRLSSFSKELKKGLLGYLDTHTPDELKTVIFNLDKVCQKAGVSNLNEFKTDTHKIIDFIKACSCLNIESRNMLYDLLNIFIKALGDSKHRDFVEFVKKFKLDI